MRVPEEFNHFCSEFDCIQVFMDLDDGSMEKAIRRAIRSLNKQQTLVVKQFLNKLLNGRYSGADLVGIWRRTPARMNLGNAKHTVEYLKLMRDLMSERLANRLPT